MLATVKKQGMRENGRGKNHVYVSLSCVRQGRRDKGSYSPTQSGGIHEVVLKTYFIIIDYN
jgi:hypothetical protein